jgi:hypothetical protein
VKSLNWNRRVPPKENAHRRAMVRLRAATLALQAVAVRAALAYRWVGAGEAALACSSVAVVAAALGVQAVAAT